jgi:hypothetical protein
MANSSLEVIERFTGEPLDEEMINRLAAEPEERIVPLVFRLQECWIEWLEAPHPVASQTLLYSFKDDSREQRRSH